MSGSSISKNNGRDAKSSGEGSACSASPPCCDDCAWACAGGCVLIRADEQPYFQAYRVFCREPGELKAGFGFLKWIGDRWGEWRKLRGLGPYAPISADQRDDFNAWLRASAGMSDHA